MVDPAVPQDDPAWLRLRLSQWRALLAQHGLRLLAVELVFTLAGAMLALPWLLIFVLPDLTVALVMAALSTIGGSFFTAWWWSAVLAILSEDLSGDSPPVAVGAALRAGLRGDGLRGVLRLWAWLVVLHVFSLPGLLIYLDIDLAMAYVRSPFSTLFEGLDWYIAFATALLPMAIMLERRGIARAWQLTHSKLSTAAGIVVVLALGFAVDQLLDEFLSGLIEILGSMVIGIPLSVLTTAAYYIIYLAHTEVSSSDNSPALSYEDSGTVT